MNKENVKELELNENIISEELSEVMNEINNELNLENHTVNSGDDLVMVFEPLEMDDELLTELTNTKEYIEGKSIGAKLLGIYLPLLNGGVPVKTCCDVILNEMTLDYNLKLQVEINKANVEISKNQIKLAKQNSL